jgi:hypothetical protein
MRGFERLRSAQVISAGYGFVESLYRGHCELGADDVVDPRRWIPHALMTRLVSAI